MRFIIIMLLVFSYANSQMLSMKNSIHSFTVEDIDGNKFSLSSLKGKKIMIVNTASKCGLTPQYKKLEALYKQFREKNFVIVGFPSNNFKGRNKHPLYDFLTKKSKNGVTDSSVSWNFQKYLIDEDGYLVEVISPRTQPDDIRILQWINNPKS